MYRALGMLAIAAALVLAALVAAATGPASASRAKDCGGCLFRVSAEGNLLPGSIGVKSVSQSGLARYSLKFSKSAENCVITANTFDSNTYVFGISILGPKSIEVFTAAPDSDGAVLAPGNFAGLVSCA